MHWPILLIVLAVSSILLQLGFWQWQRGLEKEVQLQIWQAHTQAPPLSEADLKQPAQADYLYRNLFLEGAFVQGRDILLDNQLLDGKAGYQVWTPFQPRMGGPIVLVARGWIPAPSSRQQLPHINPLTTKSVQIVGTLRQPSNNVFVSRPLETPTITWPLRIQNWSLPVLEHALGHSIYPYTLALPNSSPYVYTVLPYTPWLNAARHRAYAWQWFALAALLVGLTLTFQIKKVPHV